MKAGGFAVAGSAVAPTAAASNVSSTNRPIDARKPATIGPDLAAVVEQRRGHPQRGTHDQPFLWHRWLYHYGRNWQVPHDGRYALRVRIEPASFPRHDRVNGRRYADPVVVEFDDVHIETGHK